MTEAIFNVETSFPMPVDSIGSYPIFPAELWSRVFTFSVNNSFRSRDAILRVNRAFRFIANGTPQLWTQVFVTTRQDVLDPCRMRAGLKKSGALPLNVYIIMKNIDIQPLAEYLRKHVFRFQTLHLKLPSAKFTAEFLSAMGQDCPAPLLQQLTLDIFEHLAFNIQEADEEPDIESIALGNILHPSPRLKHLSAHPFLLPAVTKSTFLPTIKDFTFAGECTYIDEQGANRAISLLSQTPLMESFTFRVGGVDVNPLLPHLVVMPHLLSVDVPVPGIGLEVLSGIKSPLLQRICLNGLLVEEWDDLPGQLIASALDRLSQHSPKISHLELAHIAFNDPETTYPWIMGGGFPSLDVFKISNCDITDDVLWLCRPLRTMKRLELYDCKQLTLDGLLHVIEGRSSDFELKLYQCRNITQDDVVALSDVVKVEFTKYIDYRHDFADLDFSDIRVD